MCTSANVFYGRQVTASAEQVVRISHDADFDLFQFRAMVKNIANCEKFLHENDFAHVLQNAFER